MIRLIDGDSTLYIGSDRLFQLTLTNELTSEPEENADVTWQLTDNDYATIDNGSFSNVSNVYSAVLPAATTVDLTCGDQYWVFIAATAGDYTTQARLRMTARQGGVL